MSDTNPEVTAQPVEDEAAIPDWRRLGDQLAAVSAGLDALQALFQAKIQEDETKGRLFERLYLELSQLRDDFVFDKILRCCYLDMIKLYDRIQGVAARLAVEESAAPWRSTVESFAKEILQILKRQEVTPVTAEDGRFDERIHEAAETEPTSVAEEDLLVSEVIARGFLYRGQRLLRPERVKIKKFSKEER